MNALVIVNPIAGPGRASEMASIIELAKTVLLRHNLIADVRVTGGPDDARGFASDAVKDGIDLVVAWGGDGTVNRAAAAVAGTRVPLAIVPAGSGNGLARDLGVPLTPEAALEVAGAGATRAIDAGDLDGHLFFNVAGIGFDARIAARLAEPGARRGLLGYVLATLGELPGYEPACYSIREARDVNGVAHTPDIVNHHALFIALANSRQYGNGAQIAPQALLDDGMIEIVVVEPQSGFRIMRQVPAFFRGTLREGPGVLMRSAASMDICCAHPIRFHVDGEPREGGATVSLRTRRQVVTVKVSR